MLFQHQSIHEQTKHNIIYITRKSYYWILAFYCAAVIEYSGAYLWMMDVTDWEAG